MLPHILAYLHQPAVGSCTDSEGSSPADVSALQAISNITRQNWEDAILRVAVVSAGAMRKRN